MVRYFNSLMSEMIAVVVARSITRLRLPGKWCVAETMPRGDFTAIHTVPTGLSGVPPPGPAMPDVTIEQSVSITWHAP